VNAGIISVGTELLMGETVDTNSGWLAARLPALGVRVESIMTVGDNLVGLVEALQTALCRFDLVLTTGGLGPTEDDLTREAVATAIDEQISIDPKLLASLEGWFRRRGMRMSKHNIKQAGIIPSAVALPNLKGTAPGWWVEKKGRVIASLPGPPVELCHMWECEVEPRLRERSDGVVLLARTFKTIGLAESTVDEMVAHLHGTDNPYLGIYAKSDGIYLRVLTQASTRMAAMELMRPIEEGILSILRPYIWGVDDERLEDVVLNLLSEWGITLATAESGIGGVLASTLSTDPAGDPYYLGGLAVRPEEIDHVPGVTPHMISMFGAVSSEAASAMAEGVRKWFGSDVGVGITGLVGSEQEGIGVEVGTVYVSIAHVSGTLVSKHDFPPRRELIRRRAVAVALLELGQYLKGLSIP
jgi:nicotinamide-nucleotide amidase